MPEGNDPSNERTGAIVAILSFSVAFAVLLYPALLRKIYLHSDLFDYVLPIRHFYAQALARGDEFLWFPNFFSGFYLHGDGPGMYHPLNLISYAFLPFDVAFNFEILRNYPLILLGTYAFLRRWALPRDAALLGGVIFSLASFNLLHHMHTTAIAIVGHMPLLLLCIDVCMRSDDARRRRLAWLGVALLTVSQLLLGYTQYVLFSSLAEGGYAILLAIRLRHPRPLPWLLIAKLLAIVGGSVQLLPTLEAHSLSIRSAAGSGFLHTWSLHPRDLLQFWAPYWLTERVPIGHIFAVYLGSAAPVLLLWLWGSRAWTGSRRPLVVGATILGVLALILALGKHAYLYSLQTHIPIVGWFRAPARYVVLVHFAIAILAAIAYADLGTRRRRVPGFRQLAWLTPVALLSVATAFAVDPLSRFTREAFSVFDRASPLAVATGPALALAALLLVVGAARGSRAALWLLIPFTVADQTAFGMRQMFSRPPERLDRIVERLATPEENSEHRLNWGLTALSVKGARLAGGYATLRPERVLPVGARFPPSYARTGEIPEATLAAMRLAGVAYYFTDGVRYPEAGADPPKWRAVPDPMPRVRMVAQSKRAKSVARMATRIDVRRVAIVDSRLSLVDGPLGEARLLRDRPGDIAVATQSETRQLLILSEAHHPGWHARLDGAPCPIERVYGDFMGCVVEAGSHEVTFRFQPDSIRWGKFGSVAGVALALLGFAFASLRARSNTT